MRVIKIRNIVPITAAIIIIFLKKLNLGNLKLKSSPKAAILSPNPLPSVGLISLGLMLGSSQASPTGWASASDLGRIYIDIRANPLSSSFLFGCWNDNHVFGISNLPSF